MNKKYKILTILFFILFLYWIYPKSVYAFGNDESINGKTEIYTIVDYKQYITSGAYLRDGTEEDILITYGGAVNKTASGDIDEQTTLVTSYPAWIIVSNLAD